jgi:hypothetical protein
LPVMFPHTWCLARPPGGFHRGGSLIAVKRRYHRLRSHRQEIARGSHERAAMCPGVRPPLPQGRAAPRRSDTHLSAPGRRVCNQSVRMQPAVRARAVWSRESSRHTGGIGHGLPLRRGECKAAIARALRFVLGARVSLRLGARLQPPACRGGPRLRARLLTAQTIWRTRRWTGWPAMSASQMHGRRGAPLSSSRQGLARTSRGAPGSIGVPRMSRTLITGKHRPRMTPSPSLN